MLIPFDKSAESIGGQVNAFHCSSTNGDWLFAMKIQCALPSFSMRFQREFDKYKNVSGRVAIREVSCYIKIYRLPQKCSIIFGANSKVLLGKVSNILVFKVVCAHFNVG